MKKSIFSLAAVAAMAVACSVEDVNENQAPVGELFTIEAAIATTQPAPDSKTTLTVDGTAYKVEWDEEETLSVVTKSSDGTSTGNEFTKGDGNSFSGNVAEPENVTDVYVVYPHSEYHNSYNQEHDNINGYITIGSTNTGTQTQNGINSTAHVKGNLYGYAQVVDGTASVQMHHATTLFEIIVTNSTDADLSVSKIVLGNSESDDMVGNFYIAPQNGTLSSYRVSASATLNVTGENTITSGNTGKFYIVSAPFELAADAALSVGITMSDGAVYNIDKTIPSADLGKFAAGAVNHINAEITEVPEVEKIEDGEYLIVGYNDSQSFWGVMTTFNSSYYQAETVNTDKTFENISCTDFYMLPDIESHVWILTAVGTGYSLQNKTTSKYLDLEANEAGESDSPVELSIIKQADGTYLISKSGIATSNIEFNSDRFKPYENSDQDAVALIPWVEDTTPRIFVDEASIEVPSTYSTGTLTYSIKNADANDISVSIKENSATSWLSIENLPNENKFSYTVQENDGNERSATIVLSINSGNDIEIIVKQFAAGEVVYTLTINPDDFPGNSYKENNGSHDFTAIGTDNSEIQVKIYTNQIMKQSSLIQYQKNTGYFYNETAFEIISVELPKANGGPFSMKVGNSQNPDSGDEISINDNVFTPTEQVQYFVVSCGGSTGQCSEIIIKFKIE